MTVTASGVFDVQRNVLDPCDLGDGVQAMHVRFDKRFHGALDATGVVHMLAVGTPVEGSAAYVAVERISGSLDGLQGSFLTQHSGTMDRGTPTLALTVVPDSGTGDLAGFTGTMAIDIDADGTHRYRFEYAIPPAGA